VPRICVLIGLLVPAGVLAEPAVSAYVTLTTDYVYRGVSLSDSDPALQAGIDLDTEMGVYAGLWASTADIPGLSSREREREANLYVGYSRRFGRRWTAAVSITRYLYPGAPGNIDYDYTEGVLTISHRDRLWLEYAWTPSYQGHDSVAKHISLLRSWQLPDGLSLTAGGGYFDASLYGGVRYWHWEAGLTRHFGPFTADLRYHDTDGAARPISTSDTAGERLVLSLSVYF